MPTLDLSHPTIGLKKMCSQLQAAMSSLIDVFHSYSGREGDKYKLNKLELKNLLKEELSELLSVSICRHVPHKIQNFGATS